MKTNTLFIAALFIISASLSAFAKDEPSPSKGLTVTSVRGTEVFKISYQGQRTGKVKLLIYNTESEVVYSESFKNTESFVRPMNFAALSAGEYTIELIDRNGKETEKLQLNRAASRKADSSPTVE